MTKKGSQTGETKVGTTKNGKSNISFYRNANRKLNLPKNTVVIGTDGPECARCGCWTEIREHKQFGPKELRKPYYFCRWFNCVNPECLTKLIMSKEFKVIPAKPSSMSKVERRFIAIGEQLREDHPDCADIATADAF